MSEPSYLAAVRESYDTVADAYAEQVPRPADLDPPARALLGMFAETVREAGLGPLADLGCGPGYVTAHLAALGTPVFGIDLSPRMVELACPLRRVPPHPRCRHENSRTFKPNR
ncbi:methyltransferase domain-containing protein [Streptomyces sp. MBT33]|nr:class I SAM-dependent methyltransferase [Streptomyces sp. MBT33]MBK3644259.1 methyltransferase domain-containing protein [Streptomyces sp. MBT33]